MNSISRRSVLAIPTAVLAVALFAASALGATGQDWEECKGENPDVSIASCTRIIQDTRESQRNRAIAYNNRGAAWKTKGELDRAIADYTDAIKFDPKYANAYYNRGAAWRSKNEFDRAIADYTEAIRINPKDTDYFTGRGNARRGKRDLNNAILDYDEAIRLAPKNDIAYNNRGLAWDDKREYDRAIADFNEAIRLDPKYANAYGNRGHAWRGKGEPDRAISDYTEAIRLNPKLVHFYSNRGFAWSDKGEFKKALVDFTTAVDLEPNNAARYRNRGYGFFYQGDFVAAAADMLSANDLTEEPYSTLWRFLARSRMKEDANLELTANAALLKAKEWPFPVIEFYLGRRSFGQLNAAAGKVEEKCEVAFYVGQWQLLRGNAAQAKPSLESAVSRCPRTFMEYSGAIFELRRLGS